MLPDVPPPPPALVQQIASSSLEIERQIRFLPDKPFKKPLFRSANVRFVLFALEPGQTLPSHSAQSDVLMLVHQGAGTFMLGDKTIEGKAGDLIVAPFGQPHGFTATERLVVLAVIAPDPGKAI
jgi:quercetin dioxygenase-like cupin family protein